MKRSTEHLDLETAICRLLYVFCKVRGYKVILGFLSNEPKYLEPILLRLEQTVSAEDGQRPQWQVPYVLLLWLSHLLLTPFDLASISDHRVNEKHHNAETWPSDLPPIASRILSLGLEYLPTSTKAQDAAAMLLVRLVRRPDMQKLGLADSLTSLTLRSLRNDDTKATMTVYQWLGPLTLLSGIASSPELSHLVPDIYRYCQRLPEDSESAITTHAIAKKLVIKTLRDVAILSLRISETRGPLLSFFETASVLEDVLDHLLRSLGDRDTPVRFAVAKAISMIVLELDPAMREEVIQVVLDTFKEDMPRGDSQILDFRTANPLRWHGLTLCLAHALFKRSASPGQLPDIVTALVSALQFEQRTATGSSVGTNVRDAANFGIWSLSRRYTSDELLSVDASIFARQDGDPGHASIIQHLAIELVLSACLDPAGNVRRGSSAALQELIGRHPNQVKQGIALVQTVDYQAVGLRSRAMVDVAARATELDNIYFQPVQNALVEWRGLGSADVPSREGAAMALAKLYEQGEDQASRIVEAILQEARITDGRECELLHGVVTTVAFAFEKASELKYGTQLLDPASNIMQDEFATLLRKLNLEDFSSRLLRSELPSAVAKMLAAYCSFMTELQRAAAAQDMEGLVDFQTIEKLTELLLRRGEETIREAIPPLARSLLALKRACKKPLGCLASQTLTKQVANDGSKSILNGAGRAIALGALAPIYGDGLQGSKVGEIISTLGSLTQVMNVDWRITGVRALQLAIEGPADGEKIDGAVLQRMIDAVHNGLTDYTIDERGDVGSLVRLQAIACTSAIFAKCTGAVKDTLNSEPLRVLHADILRLSLEKLDRVRLAAAQCQDRHLGAETTSSIADIATVSTYHYTAQQFKPLVSDNEEDWKSAAILEGAISAAGISSEQLLQASRAALATTLSRTSDEQLSHLLTSYTTILKASLASSTSPLTTPSLTLLAFLLDMQIPQRLAQPTTPFKWLTLLSAVQKSHHKSNDILKIAAAVAVYRGLAEVQAIRVEVLKKLLGMLRTNPYPRVRVAVAEALFVCVGEETEEARDALKRGDWMADRKGNDGAVKELERLILRVER